MAAPNTKMTSRVWQARAGAVAARYKPYEIVQLARKQTEKAIHTLVALMEGKGGTMDDGTPIEVPPAVRLRAAEILIERGYGKAPQAIHLTDETEKGLQLGERTVTLAEKIIKLREQMRERDGTVDLEASQIVPAPPVINVTPTPVPATADDLI